jgi:hypothetical protein
MFNHASAMILNLSNTDRCDLKLNVINQYLGIHKIRAHKSDNIEIAVIGK